MASKAKAVIEVEPLGQVAAHNASLLLVLASQANAAKWGDEETKRTALVSQTNAFGKEHVGWVPVGKSDGSEGVAIFLTLDDETGTADLYRVGADRFALVGPGHTYVEEQDDVPGDARSLILARIAEGPSKAAKRAGQLELDGLLVVADHTFTGDAVPGKAGAFESETGSSVVAVPPGSYNVLIEGVTWPWAPDEESRLAFVLPESDRVGARAKDATLAGLEDVAKDAPITSFGIDDGGKRLNLVQRGLRTLPEGVRDHAGTVEELDCHYNQLKALPSWLSELRLLRKLYAYNNELERLPREVGALTRLEELALSDNQLSELPEELGQLTELRVLSLEKNKKLKVLPASLAKLTKLRFLDLSGTALSEVPAWMCTLQGLEELNLRGTKLNSLPEGLAALGKTEVSVGKKCEIPDGLRKSQLRILQY